MSVRESRQLMPWQQKIRDLCSAGEFNEVLMLVERSRSITDIRYLIQEIIESESYEVDGILDRALGIFLKAADDDNNYKIYDEYRHYLWSLSFFDGLLWHRRKTEWLKRLYRTAIAGALTRNVSENLHYLAEHFAAYSHWSDDSRDFYLVPAAVGLIRFFDHKNSYARARIRARKFNSEVEFLQWRIFQPEAVSNFDSSVQQEGMVDLGEIDKIIRRLAELGVDTSAFKKYPQDLLEKQLARFRKLVARTKDQFDAGNLIKAIEITENQLILVNEKKL